MGKNKQLPQFIKSVLWSYDIKTVSLERDKRIIITQCLNYGTLGSIKWLFRTYGEAEIKKVVSEPNRGMWWKKVLNFWVTVLDIEIPKKTFENAIIKLKPDFITTH